MDALLLVTILLPAAGGVALLALRATDGVSRALGMVASIVAFVFSLGPALAFDPAAPGFQLVTNIPWIDKYAIAFHVGIDGMALLLVLLTTLLFPISLAASWKSVTTQTRLFVAMMLFLETGILGVFCSLDLVLFYLFWEAMLIPMYFIIGIWGGKNRIYAAVKFFLFTMAGSLLMLVAIVWLGYQAAGGEGLFVTDLTILREVAPELPETVQLWLFLAFTLSFAIKVPVFPLHTWLPDAHVEAPTAGSVILAGVLLKLGTFGLLRYSVPLFPEAAVAAAPWMAGLAVIGIVYGALVSMVQTDMKKLVAYSSVSHLGFVVLGIFGLTEEAVQGSIIQMVNHGLSTGALFLMVGMVYDRRHTREIAEFGGLAKPMPVYAVLLMIVSLSSAGLPGLNGFVGEFLILAGSYNSPYIGPVFTIVAASGVILAAVYLLWMYQRVVLGETGNPLNRELKDVDGREKWLLAPLLILIVWIGVYPSTFLSITGGSAADVVRSVSPRSDLSEQALP
jgi:NADH-quinone oxidoreductase subunit M